MKRESADLKSDKYRLACNHEGKVVWVSEDHKVIGVAGVSRSCQNCGKKSSGNWSPNIYLIKLNGEEQG